MAKFNYKKWVTENKYGKLNEQTGSGAIPGGMTSSVFTGPGGITGTPATGTGSFEPGSVTTQAGGTQTCYYCYQGTVVQATSSINPTAPEYIFDSNCNVIGENVANNVPSISGTSTSFNFIGAQLYMNYSQTVGGPIHPNELTGTTPASWQWTTNSNACEEVGIDSEEEEGSFGTGGNYEVFDYPPAFNPSNWTANFIDLIINHPNPCNFLTQRITLFMNQLQSGVGPLHANQLMQKMAVCQELFQMIGCGGMNEQISGIKRHRLDPKAAAVIKKMAPKLKGLAKRKRGRKRVRKENKQLSTIKRIIKETLSELQEKQKACSCRGNVCKTAGGDLCPSSECEGKCKGVEDTVTKKS